MTRMRGIVACVAVACPVALGCSGEGNAFDASASTGDSAAPSSGPPEREWRDAKTSLDRERAALFYRAKALNVCASTLGDASMHTIVQCPLGMQYDHGSEMCFSPKYEPSPAGDECRNGEDRCVGSAKQACTSGRWGVLQTHASGEECEKGLRADHMKMLE
jgi:hypothetical protein